MRRPVWMLTLALTTLLVAGQALAAGFTLELNQSRRVALHGTAANVFVADPAVADVAMIDSHSVIVLGKGYGVTQVLVTDHAGHTLMDSSVAVVGSDRGRVTVYRGETAMDYHCSSRCEILASPVPSATAGGPGAQGAPAGNDNSAPLNVGAPVTVTPVAASHP
jgi:hypothetical protein